MSGHKIFAFSRIHLQSAQIGVQVSSEESFPNLTHEHFCDALIEEMGSRGDTVMNCMSSERASLFFPVRQIARPFQDASFGSSHRPSDAVSKSCDDCHIAFRVHGKWHSDLMNSM